MLFRSEDGEVPHLTRRDRPLAARKGAITPGQMGDFAVLDRDYFTVTDAEIAKLKSDLTVLNGEVVFGNGEFAHHDLRHLPPISPDWSPVVLQGTEI